MSEELKPCPFCGGEAKFVESRDSVIPGKLEVVAWNVQCSKCGASTLPNNYYGDKKEAANRWNTRAERTCRYEPTNRCTHVCTSCGREVETLHLGYNYCTSCGSKVIRNAD